MKALALSIFVFVAGLELNAQNQSILYIDQYKHIAISEMNRTGIPASIKMAQALLESGAGKSTLAQKANNHFGIKCGKSWDGKTFYREDDDYDKKGKLIKSCFRKFKSVETSYIAHSNFLSNQNRYSSLFNLDPLDYEGWAYGLKDAGYATDSRYPQKLIDIIEKYDLAYLDSGTLSTPLYANSETKEYKLNEEEPKAIAEASNNTKQNSRSRSSKKNKKRTKNQRTNKEYHVIADNQTIEDIASLYRINANKLRIRNRLPKDALPLTGEKIYLRKKISLLRRPKFIRVRDDALASNEYIF